MTFADSYQRFARWSAAGLLAGCIGLTGLTGCVSDAAVRAMQLDVHQIKLDVGALQASQTAETRKLQYTLEEIQKSLEAQRKSQTEFADEMDQRLASIREDLAKVSLASERGAAGQPSYPTGLGSPNAVGGVAEAAGGAASASDRDLLRQGDEAYSLADYDKAIELYSQFLVSGANSPQAAYANYSLGRCHYMQENFETALNAFNYLLETYPASTEYVAKSLDSRALCEFNLKRYDAALATIKKIQTTYPDYDPERIELIRKSIENEMNLRPQ